MTPHQFLDRLLVHYSKRHASEEAEAVWQQEMLEIVGKTAPDVLAKAYTMLRSEHEERAFPLPATINKFIARASSVTPAEHRPFKPVPDAPAPSPEAMARVAGLVEEFKQHMLRHKLPLNELAPHRDVSRAPFQQMQRAGGRQSIHIDHQALARRITGERE